ncbi:hypothetical protein CP532_6446 [Ophiocordyceps camponoti-leonardi (nom. inval.)]|nr:hypothetical protein CP532_6446 [Ophiocordyceps camponoti-leonardi (nom. inval.)]
MMTARVKNGNVRLLACLVDEEETSDSDYRFLVDGQHVKYVTTEPGVFRGSDNRNFEPLLLSELLPQFPPGDWNKGHIDRDPETGEAAFVRTEKVQFEGVENTWHPVKINELDLKEQDRVYSRVHISTHPKLNGGKPVLFKLAVWPYEIPWVEDETAAYQWLKGSGLAPRFLGHVTEGKEGRVIGFVAEWLEDARIALPEDMESCKKALGRLHELGIKHGDVHNPRNFLVRENGEVLMIDFESSRRDRPAEELEEEMKVLIDSKLEDKFAPVIIEPSSDGELSSS